MDKMMRAVQLCAVIVLCMLGTIACDGGHPDCLNKYATRNPASGRCEVTINFDDLPNGDDLVFYKGLVWMFGARVEQLDGAAPSPKNVVTCPPAGTLGIVSSIPFRLDSFTHRAAPGSYPGDAPAANSVSITFVFPGGATPVTVETAPPTQFTFVDAVAAGFPDGLIAILFHFTQPGLRPQVDNMKFSFAN